MPESMVTLTIRIRGNTPATAKAAAQDIADAIEFALIHEELTGALADSPAVEISEPAEASTRDEHHPGRL